MGENHLAAFQRLAKLNDEMLEQLDSMANMTAGENDEAVFWGKDGEFCCMCRLPRRNTVKGVEDYEYNYDGRGGVERARQKCIRDCPNTCLRQGLRPWGPKNGGT